MSEQLSIMIDRGNNMPLVVPVQRGGTILRGTCGVGKSVLLAQIAAALGNPDRDVVKATAGDDGTRISVCGVVLSVSPKRASVSGEAEVGSLEDFSVESLIYPPVKDADAKNEHAIKCLLRIAKAEADVKQFHYLAGTKADFDSLVKPDAQRGKDLVDLAGRVKRAIQEKKREAESEAVKEEAAAAADRDAMKGHNPNTETDGARLQQAHTAAVQRHAKLKTEWDAWCDGQEAAEQARKKLTEATGGSKSVDECQDEEDAKREAYKVARDRVKEIENELRVARAESQAAYDSLASAEEQTRAAEKTAGATRGWQAAIDAMAGAVQPDLDKLTEAEEAVESAQKAIETGAVVRAAKQRETQAKAHQAKADEFRKLAHRLTLAADGTDAVLSKALASPRFSVKGGIIMGTLNGETKPYFAMSDGQRTELAVDEKIAMLVKADPGDRLKLLDLGQRSAQDLPPSIIDQVMQKAYEANVCILCGMVSDDPTLIYEIWKPRKDESV